MYKRQTFTIVTTAADPGLDRIHDRQPLVLDPEYWSGWLDPAVTDPHRVSQWLGFARPGRFAAHPVSTAVNGSSGKGPGLIEPLPVELLRGAVDPSTGEVIGQ